MRRTLLTLVTVAALTTGLPLTAHARTADESADGGRPHTSENVQRGRGQADAPTRPQTPQERPARLDRHGAGSSPRGP